MKQKLAYILPILAVLFALSPLATAGFNGFTAEQFPVVQDRWAAQPAGWAFSIWGVIYLWLIAGLVFGALRRADANDWQDARWPLAVSLAVGIPWIAVANIAPVIATVMIIVMAATAIIAMLRAGRSDPLLQAEPIGLYAGWLTAASGVAVSVTLSGYGVLAPFPAALIPLAAAILVALYVQDRRPRVLSYPLAVAWAAFGIIMANLGTQNMAVIVLAALGILSLAMRSLFLNGASK